LIKTAGGFPSAVLFLILWASGLPLRSALGKTKKKSAARLFP